MVENQLEKSDHDHLGKLITYSVAIGAKTAVWIVADPRPEHVNAITWLNESGSANFYLLKIEAIRIGNSSPAPLLTVIVGPSEEGQSVGKTKKDIAERHLIREKFWAGLLEYAKNKAKLHSGVRAGQNSWISTGAGKYGLGFNYAIRQTEGQVELYIDRGKEGEEENQKIFDQLNSHKQEVESSFGETLEWQPLEGKRACRIRKIITIGGYRDDEKWPEIYEQMVDAMVRLEKSIGPFIGKLEF